MEHFEKRLKEEIENQEVPADKIFKAIEKGINQAPKGQPFWKKRQFLALSAAVVLLASSGVIYSIVKNNEYAASYSKQSVKRETEEVSQDDFQAKESTKAKTDIEQETGEVTTKGATEFAAEDSDNSSTANEGDEADTKAEAQTEEAQTTNQKRKIITNVTLNLESKQFDKSLQSIEKLVKETHGYIESYSSNGSVSSDKEVVQENETSDSRYSDEWMNLARKAELVLRIPQDKLETTLPKLEKAGKVMSKEMNNQDVTLYYQDTESHKKVLLAEQEKLIELLAKAENVNEMISLEQRLSTIRYEVERLESQLRSYDNQIDYATVYLELRDVKTYSKPTKEASLGSQISEGFQNNFIEVKEGLKNLLVWLASNSISLLLVAGSGLVIYYGVKKWRNR